MKKVAVVGGGVSGILATLELQKRNFHVDIYDQDFLTGNMGFGFLVMPNGVGGLKQMGYWNHLMKKGTPIDDLVTYHDTKGLLKTFPMDGVWGFSRVDFLIELSKEIKSEVTYIQQFVTLDEQRKLRIDDDEFPVDKYEWVLGCDGSNSSIRRFLFSDSEIIDAPTYELNGTFMDEEFTKEYKNQLVKIVFDQPGIAVGFLPLSTGKVIWFIQLAAKHFPIPSRNSSDINNLIRSLLVDAKHPLIQNTLLPRLNESYLWKGRILIGVDQYIKEKFVLLGDAAHLFLPFTSQGTNMAIEDVMSFVQTLESLNSRDDIAHEHFNNRRELVEQVAFQGMDFAHSFSNENYEYMLNHIPMVFTK